MSSTPLVLAAARVLGERFAQATNTNREDVLAIYSHQLRDDATAVLEAVGVPGLVEALVRARDYIQTNRDSLAASHMNPATGKLVPENVCADDDQLLRVVSAALAKATGRPA